MPANDVPLPVDDRAERVHDREDGDLRRADLAEGAALARELSLLEAEGLADRDRAAGSSASEREHSVCRSAKGYPPQLCIGVDRVLAAAEVVDDRPEHELDVRPPDGVPAHRHQLGGDAARRFEPVQRTACEADGMGPLVVPDRPRRAAADVDRAGGAPGREVEDRAARRPLLVLGDPNAEAGEVEAQLPTHKRARRLMPPRRARPRAARLRPPVPG